MRPVIEETSTITAKGQTTVPKAVRQTLGVDCGGKITYRIEDGQVTVHNPEAEHHDPAVAAYLDLIAKDIAAGRNLGELPPGVVAAARRLLKTMKVDPDEPIEGDVAI
jgi:antitoxin PrlF